MNKLKKNRKRIGLFFLVMAVILIIFGTVSRSMFYGIMDAPYSVYGKFWTLMKIFYGTGIAFAVLSVVCLITGKRK